jgi:sodium-dependent dicarboxylate transporter 2/3/5
VSFLLEDLVSTEQKNDIEPSPGMVPEETGAPAVRRKRSVGKSGGLLVGALGFVLILALPLGLDTDQRQLAAVMWLVVVLWITEALPLPVTSLLGLGLCAMLGIAPATETSTSANVVFSSFSSSVVFLLVGGFLFARAIQVHGLDQRLALRVLAIPGVAVSTHRVVIAFGVIAMTISAFVSNSATAAMLVPMGVGLINTLSVVPAGRAGTRTRLGTAMMLMIAYAAALGGLLTPVGSPANLVGIGYVQELSGRPISFIHWTATAAPIVAIMFVLLCVVILLLNRPEQRAIPAADFIDERRAALGPMRRAEKNTLIAFALVVAGWVSPGVVSIAAAGTEFADAYTDRVNDGSVAILAAVLLFLLPGDTPGSRVLTWKQGTQIDWGVILLVGTGITLGTLLKTTGLAALAGDGLGALTGMPSLIGITLLAAVLSILLSELASNTASVAVVVPIVIPIAAAAGVNPIVPAVAAIFGGSFGFMLPISQIPNAIVYGTGLVPIPRMVRTGVIFDVLGALLVTAGILLWSPVVGLT